MEEACAYMMARFHEHCQWAKEEAHDKLFEAMYETAVGGPVYKKDEFLVALGFEGPDAYAKDENGDPIVEAIRPQNRKMQLRILQWKRPERWAKKRRKKVDGPHSGGVIVVGDVTKKLENSSAASIEARRWKANSRMIQETKD